MNKPSFSWRPKTTLILITSLVVALIYSVVLYAATHFQPTVEVRMGSGVYYVAVADSEASRIQGLSGVEELRPNGGLLMKFDEDGLHGIWMKDMKVSLDIVWLDKNKEVIYIVKNAAPEMSTSTIFTPKTPARYVIELPAGSVAKAAIRTGSSAVFDESKKSQGIVWR